MEPVQNQSGPQTQVTPPSPPSAEKPPVTPITEVTPVSRASKGLPSKIFLLSGPLFLLVSLGISVYLVKQPPGALELRGRASETAPKSDEETIREMFQNAPLNPTSAIAVCQSTNEVLQSGKPTDCPDPLFTWSGEQTREPGTKIAGYYVYFGEKSNDSPLGYKASDEERLQAISPIGEGVLIKENKFTPADLVQGKTYYLAAQAMASSQNPLWRIGLSDPDPSALTASAAKILFIYQYE